MPVLTWCSHSLNGDCAGCAAVELVGIDCPAQPEENGTTAVRAAVVPQHVRAARGTGTNPARGVRGTPPENHYEGLKLNLRCSVPTSAKRGRKMKDCSAGGQGFEP